MSYKIFSMRRRLASTVLRKSLFNVRHKHKKNARKYVNMKYRRLKAEMAEIGKEQESIREGQSQVREKFDAIEAECEVLKDETQHIIQRIAVTHLRLTLVFNILKAREEQFRLVLMFQILKAREEGDFAKAAQFTQFLRELI